MASLGTVLYVMAKPGRLTTCGHSPYHAKEMCRSCYFANYRSSEDQREKARAYRASTAEKRRVYDRERWAAADKDVERERAQRNYAASPDRRRETQRVYDAANAERLAITRKAWVKTHVDEQREYFAAYFQSNKERRTESTRLWCLANPERVAVSKNRRRARFTEGSDLTAEEWLDVLDEFDHRCAYCNRNDLPLALEHMTPLSRHGRHTRTNVVPACRPCNSQKHTKTALEFIGRLFIEERVLSCL